MKYRSSQHRIHTTYTMVPLWDDACWMAEAIEFFQEERWQLAADTADARAMAVIDRGDLEEERFRLGPSKGDMGCSCGGIRMRYWIHDDVYDEAEFSLLCEADEMHISPRQIIKMLNAELDKGRTGPMAIKAVRRKMRGAATHDCRKRSSPRWLRSIRELMVDD